MSKFKLKIDDRFVARDVDFFNSVSMDLRFNTVGSIFDCSFYFDPFNPGHKELACIGHYHLARLLGFNEKLLEGFILSQKFRHTSEAQLAFISGYSKPGVIEDCTIPPSLMPLQTDGLSLTQIAERLLAPFKIDLEVDPSVSARANKVFGTTTASDNQTIKDYLSELARQRNIVLSHTLDGKLLFTEANVKSTPILEFDNTAGVVGGLEFDLDFNGQAMHSDITVFGQASIDGGNARQTAIENPYVPVVYRPTTATQSSGDENDISLAARRALSNELANIKLTIQMDRWEFKAGEIITPNNTITIKDPYLYLYDKKYTWFIESVNLTLDETGERATLHCVLPEVYTNEVPEYFFKGINITAKPHI